MHTKTHPKEVQVHTAPASVPGSIPGGTDSTFTPGSAPTVADPTPGDSPVKTVATATPTKAGGLRGTWTHDDIKEMTMLHLQGKGLEDFYAAFSGRPQEAVNKKLIELGFLGMSPEDRSAIDAFITYTKSNASHSATFAREAVTKLRPFLPPSPVRKTKADVG